MAGLVWLTPKLASAQPVPVELTWRAPPECPSREAVLVRLRTLLGAGAATIAPLRAEGVIDKRAEGFELRLTIDEIGERRVVARRCNELGGAAAVALALLINSAPKSGEGDKPASGVPAQEPGSGSNGTTSTAPQSGEAPASSEPAASGAQPSTSSPAQPRAAAKQREPSGDVEPAAPSPARAWRLLLDVPALAVGFGPLPKPSASVAVAAGLGVGGWSLRLLGRWPSTQTLTSPVVGYGAETRHASAALWTCRDVVGEALSLAACLQVSGSYLRASGTGPHLGPREQTETWLGLGAGAVGRLKVLDSLALMVGAGVQVELARPRIVIENVGLVGQLAPVSATLFIGPEWIL